MWMILTLECRELLVAHGAVAGSEINGARGYLADAAAAADGLIVDFNPGMRELYSLNHFE